MASINFKGKTAVWNHHLSVPYHTLEKDKKNSLEGKNDTENLIIEGDNLLALKALLPKYQGKVKCIYIDPPYNTGNEGWVYNDNVNNPVIKNWIGEVVGKEGEDLVRHDKWLSMMTPRLKLLKEMLKDDGVIFMSIDDNENHHSKILLDEIFGNKNWVGTIVWKNVTDNNPTNISIEHEYIHCYAKNKENISNVWKSKVSIVKDLLVQTGSNFVKKYSSDELQDVYKKWFTENKDQLWPLDRYKYIDAGGIYTGSQSVHNPGKEGYRYDVIHPVTKKPCKQPLMGYRFPEKTMAELLDKGLILFGEDENKIIELKLYASEYQDKLPSVINYDGRLAAYELRELFPEADKIFDNLKPVELIKQLISFVTEGNDIILDSFAGSGTTGQAVLNLNEIDKSDRRFILIQIPEELDKKSNGYKIGFKNVHEITRERIVRFINKNKIKSGLTYYKLGPDIDGKKILTGKNMPTWDVMAKYVHFLATGKPIDEVTMAKKTWEITATKKGTGVYLIYADTLEELKKLAITRDWLEAVKDKAGKKIVYAPACFLDKEILDEYNISFVQVPFNLFTRK